MAGDTAASTRLTKTKRWATATDVAGVGAVRANSRALVVVIVDTDAGLGKKREDSTVKGGPLLGVDAKTTATTEHHHLTLTLIKAIIVRDNGQRRPLTHTLHAQHRGKRGERNRANNAADELGWRGTSDVAQRREQIIVEHLSRAVRAEQQLPLTLMLFAALNREACTLQQPRRNRSRRRELVTSTEEEGKRGFMKRASGEINPGGFSAKTEEVHKEERDSTITSGNRASEGARRGSGREGTRGGLSPRAQPRTGSAVGSGEGGAKRGGGGGGGGEGKGRISNTTSKLAFQGDQARIGYSLCFALASRTGRGKGASRTSLAWERSGCRRRGGGASATGPSSGGRTNVTSTSGKSTTSAGIIGGGDSDR